METGRPEIGRKLRRLRVKLGLTQEELAARTELTKGFISQLENDITSPSIATLIDILEALGTDISAFFNDRSDARVVFTPDDTFEKEDGEAGTLIRWLVPNAQKNALEPILVTIRPGGKTEELDPHEGEEFGLVLSGAVTLVDGDTKHRVRKGDSFYLHPQGMHYLFNSGKTPAKVLWISTPPSF